MNLTIAERLLIGQIVNVRLNSASLGEHIKLESIYKTVDPDSVSLPFPLDYVNEEQKLLFEKYDRMQIDDIENKDHQEILRNAMIKSNEERNRIWNNGDKSNFEVNLTKDEIVILKEFYDSDKRTFPKQYHKAILSLYGKITDDTLKKKK